MPSILFVCSANQCRSPMAEVLFRDLVLSEKQADGEWVIASAGCWAYPRMPAISKAVIAASNLGADLIDHNSQSVTAELLEDMNLILCMETAHVAFIKRHFPQSAHKVFLLSEMINENFEIEDPIGRTQSDYDQSAQAIIKILHAGWVKIARLSTVHKS